MVVQGLYFELKICLKELGKLLVEPYCHFQNLLEVVRLFVNCRLVAIFMYLSSVLSCLVSPSRVLTRFDKKIIIG